MIKEYAYAKINLALDVVKKREDGYHDLKTIMIPIELSDELIFEHASYTFIESNIDIQNNSIVHAIKAMKDHFKIDQHVKVTLTKKIPIGAGLGGGSADIAATLRGLNRLWNIDAKINELESIALSLGSDTLFCLYNRPAFIYGRGEHIQFLEPMDLKEVYLIALGIEVSTKKVFLAHSTQHQEGRFEKVLDAYNNDNFKQLIDLCYNDLSLTTRKLYPQVHHAYESLIKLFPNLRMTGSGSTHFVLSEQPFGTQQEEEIKQFGFNMIKTKAKI